MFLHASISQKEYVTDIWWCISDHLWNKTNLGFRYLCMLRYQTLNYVCIHETKLSSLLLLLLLNNGRGHL